MRIALCFVAGWLLMWPATVRAQFNFTTNNGVITITGYTGSGNVSIPSTTNGYSVTSIGDFAFSTFSVYGVTKIIIPDSITNIGNYAFDGCYSLTNATFGTNAISLGTNAFALCTKLATFKLPTSVTRVGDNVCNGCTSLTNVTIGTNFTSIPSGTFEGCSNLKNISIPNSVTNIKSSAFQASGLVNIIIPNSVTLIVDYAFDDLLNLTNATIGSNVVSIGTGTFSFCSRLTSVTIPASVTSIGDAPFSLCGSLTNISVIEQNQFFSSVNGVLFNKNQTKLIQYPPGNSGSFAIPKSVTNIASKSFFGCYNLTSLEIPNSVSSVGFYAFSSCTSLTNVYFKGNAPTDGGSVFLNDSNTIVFYLPNTTGWSATFSGTPAVLWNPTIPNDRTLGVQSNQFGFTITGTTNIPVVVEASTNFGSGWTLLKSLNLTNGSFYFNDPQWTNYSARFYRFRSP
jgi:BspA type Leucine rich repeat region (6 copies)